MVAVEGVSGAGKTTLVDALATGHGLPTVAEAFDRLAGRVPLTFTDRSELLAIERALLAEDLRRYQEAHRYRRGRAAIVVDTDFVGVLTYVLGLVRQVDPKWNVLPALTGHLRTAVMDGSWGVADRYLYLATPLRTALDRAAAAPGSHPAALRRRHARVGRWEREFFLRRLPLLLPGRVEVLAGEAPVHELLREVSARLKRKVPSATRNDSLRVLEWFERAANR